MPLPSPEQIKDPSTSNSQMKNYLGDLIGYVDKEVLDSSQVQSRILDAVNDPISQNSNLSNLYEFNDGLGRTVVKIAQNGDVVNPNYSLNEVGKLSDQNSNYLKKLDDEIDLDALSSLESTKTASLYNFADSDGETAVSIEEDGDIKFFGGLSLKKELIKSDTSKTTLKPKENVSSDFVSHLMNGMFWNGAKRSNLFVGAVKQNYHIKTATDFLNLRITEPSNPLIISTPYLKASHTVSPHSQVVHPFVCEFKDKPFGFKYILLATPFHGTNDQLENPTVWGSNDLQNFDLLNYFDQPLAHALPIERYNYNSDNFAVYDHTTGEFCVFYRNSILTADKTAVDTNRLYVRKTLDFVNWTSPELILKEDGDPLSSMMLSPNIIFNTALQKWQMFAVDWGDGIVDGQPGYVSGYSYRTSDYLTHGWSELHKINTPQGIDCWHQETRYAGSHFICIMNDIYSNSGALNGKGNLYLGISMDGENFDFSASVFSGNFNNPYKATITPELTKNGVKFNIMWSSNGNYHDGWKLYSTSTAEIEVE